MKIFEPKPAENFEWINTTDDSDYELFLAFDGIPRGHAWSPPKVRRVPANYDKEKNESDFPWLGGHALILRRKSLEILNNVLQTNGEVLPLADVDGAELFVFNAQVIDCLDEKNSDFIRFPNTGRIMKLKSVAFQPNVIEGLDVFRLPHRATPTYVSERFVQMVQSAGLVGLDFKEVWKSADINYL